MANQEHLNLLKQGTKIWNKWRSENQELWIDLSNINLSGIDLSGVDLDRGYLTSAYLSGTNLQGANLHLARLSMAYLNGANLCGADLSRASLRDADLRDANLREAKLSFANITGTKLNNADMHGAKILATTFGDVDLSKVIGLDAIAHGGPSTIGIDTIYRSKGVISEAFLRAAGVPGSFITYARSLVGLPIDYYTCFISYSSRDESFAKRLYADLQSNGVRCWFAAEDLKIGDHYHQLIDESIRIYDKLVLIITEQAVQSAWVEREVVAAREKEDREHRSVLFPIRLDDAVMTTTKAWAADIRRRWHIGDFTRWKEHDAYQQAFERLLGDLKTETRK